MHNYYRVKSNYYVSQINTDFEYHWFVYQRGANYPSRAAGNSPSTSQTNAVTRQIEQELFTFEEAYQLQAMLKSIFAELNNCMEVITTIEEAPTSFVSEELCLLKDTYQDEGEYVDPFDFASLESYSLNFLVAAKVTNQTRYTAENFLCYLTPERLGALRQMHAEMMG